MFFRTRAVLSAIAVTALVCTASATGAAATAGADEPTRTQVIDAGTLTRLAGAGENAGLRAQAQRQYADSQARQGRLVDVAATRSAVVDGTTVTWDAPLAVEQVVVDTVPAADGAAVPDAQGVQIKAHAGESRADGVAPLSTGAGLGAAAGVSGGTWINGYCVSTTTSGGTATSCFEKYRISQKTTTRDYFYYGRWATATGNGMTPTLIDIRSRPWAGSTAVATMSNYWPKAGQNLCTSSGSIGFESKGFSISVPIQDCTEISPIPNGTTMGVIYDQGAIYNGRSHGADFGMVVDAFKGRVPSMADYTYVKFCGATYANCNGNLRKDSGW